MATKGKSTLKPDVEVRKMLQKRKEDSTAVPGVERLTKSVDDLSKTLRDGSKKQEKQSKIEAKNQSKLLQDIKDSQLNVFKKVGDSVKEVSSMATGFGKQATHSFVNAMAGPISGIVEQATGKSLGEMVTSKLSGIGGAIKSSFMDGFDKNKSGGLFGEDTPTDEIKDDVKDMKKIMIEGDKRDKERFKNEKKSKFGKLGKDEDDKKTSGFMGMISKVFGKGGTLGAVLGGVAGVMKSVAVIGAPLVAIGTVLTDFLGKGGGLSKFMSGDILGGVTTTLLGRKAETDADAGKNMLKQTAKGASIGYMIGGPLGGAIGAGIGLVASGVKGAFEREWDKNAKDIGASIGSIWSDPDKGIGSKILGTFGAVGKGGIFGPIAGGLRNVVDGMKEKMDEAKGIWQDQSTGIFTKLGKTSLVGLKALGDMGSDFLVGSMGSFKNFILGATGDFFPNMGKGIKKLFVGEDGKGGILGKVAPVAGKVDSFIKKIPGINTLYGAGKEFYGGIAKGVVNFFGDVKEKGLGTTLVDRAGDAVSKLKDFGTSVADSVKGFVSDVKERGLGTVLKDKRDEVVNSLKSKVSDMGKSINQFMTDMVSPVVTSVSGFFVDIGQGIKDFFGSIWQGFKDKVSGGWEAVKGFFTGEIFDKKFTEEAEIRMAEARAQSKEALKESGWTAEGVPGVVNNNKEETTYTNGYPLPFSTGAVMEGIR